MAETPTPLAELDALIEKLRGCDDPRRASAEWKQVHRLLGKTELDPGRFQGVVGLRDVTALAELIEQLHGPVGATDPAEVPDAATCRKAFQAFRKRAKLTRLDDESKLGRGPLSKGGDRSLSAIAPPAEWPDAVWQELIRQGRIRYLGHGLYDLPKP